MPPDALSPAAIRDAAAAVIREVCETPDLPLSADSRLDAIEPLDSLRLMEAVALLEDRFGVMVETGALESLTTFADVVALIAAAPPMRVADR